MARQLDDTYMNIATGQEPGYSVIHKFGSYTVGTSVVPLTRSGVYKTPTTATALEFVSSDANDTSAGTGAREVTVVGLNSSWEEVTQTVTTNGVTPVALSTDLIRLYRWYVSASGTYATQSTGSHVGTLTIRESGGGATWSIIDLEDSFPLGQSLIGAYTIPSGYTGYLKCKKGYVDSTKSADIYFFRRTNADTVSAPYSSIRILEFETGVQGEFETHLDTPKLVGVGPCDCGLMGHIASGTAAISAEFELILVANG